MADAFRPLTLLLGAVCLWALSVLVLALAGLGSRFSAAGYDGEPPPLPGVSLTRSQSRLGPMADYLVVGERPLLTLDRRPAPTMAANGQAGAAELDVTLTSVMITPRLQLAILTDNKDASTRRVRVGETVEGSNWRLVRLEPRSAVIEGPSGQRTLELRVYDGKGGKSPTPIITVADSGATPAGMAGPGPQSPASPPVRPQSIATASAVVQQPAEPTQEQQVEAIRRRIEARRAQMRAEADAAASTAQ